MENVDNLFILCDTEEEYAQLFGEYLRKQKEQPWEIRIYTDVEELMQKEQRKKVAMLVVAEDTYCEELKSLQPQRVVLLNESGMVRWQEVRNINKYQQAEVVFKELLEIYMEIARCQLPRLKTGYGTKFIGIYSPVRRCLQTSFALTMGQLLAREHTTLYLNFEPFAGVKELLPDGRARDLGDLLYFLNAEKDKFQLWLQTMRERCGGLDYIPSMRVGQNLLTITTVEWLNLLQRIGELGEYEYVVLDLSESMQGLFDILRICVKVFTMVVEDGISEAKLLQYEQVLKLCEYEDILQKTKKCCLPPIKKLPIELVQYTRGELAEYVKREITELEGMTNDGLHAD